MVIKLPDKRIRQLCCVRLKYSFIRANFRVILNWMCGVFGHTSNTYFGFFMRGQKLRKLFTAIELFSRPGGITVRELQENLKVDRTSVYRLIRTMEDLGFPLLDEKPLFEKEKRWRLEDRYITKLPNLALPTITLNLKEIIALYLIKGEAATYKGTEIEKTLDTIFNRINNFIPADLDTKLARIKTLFISTDKLSKNYSGKEDIIDQIADAIIDQKTCYVNPSFRVGVKILHDYSLFHFLNVCYGTTFVYYFLNRHTRVKTYPQGRINFLLPWLWPSAFSYMHHITIFTVHGNSDSILAV
jgi:DNA-binding MarR family transcriptional regulator